MRLNSLKLRDFRSYDALQLSFGEEPRQMFVGDNGSGKTNIVEAVSLLSQGRSCLRAELTDVLRWNTDFFRIDADMTTDDGVGKQIACVFQVSPRRASAFFVQDVRMPLLQFIGVLPTIIFLPQDLDLFTGPPAGRRGFLDALLSQLQPSYAALRLEYERVLKQRNALLKRIVAGEAKESELDLWDERLSTGAAPIVKRRTEILSTISELLPAELKALKEKLGTVSAVWREHSHPELTDLSDRLKHFRHRDLLVQSTTSGPHRDDWALMSDGRSIAVFASRGQQRAMLLGLLFVSASLFRTVRGERPVILLDDVLSELDQHHQEALVTHLKDHQVFITSTHELEAAKGSMALWTVQEGRVAKR